MGTPAAQLLDSLPYSRKATSKLRMQVAALGVFLSLALSACIGTPQSANSWETTTSAARIADTENATRPWYEGRRWAGEIDVCVEATNDASGCQWLAGMLIHRRCELKIYQTFAAALFIGASFEAIYGDAIAKGECAPRDDLEAQAG